MNLNVGDQIIHNARAMELLYRIGVVNTKIHSEVWKIKLLFVPPREDVEQFIEGDHVSYLHTKTAKTAVKTTSA